MELVWWILRKTLIVYESIGGYKALRKVLAEKPDPNY